MSSHFQERRLLRGRNPHRAVRVMAESSPRGGEAPDGVRRHPSRSFAGRFVHSIRWEGHPGIRAVCLPYLHDSLELCLVEVLVPPPVQLVLGQHVSDDDQHLVCDVRYGHAGPVPLLEAPVVRLHPVIMHCSDVRALDHDPVDLLLESFFILPWYNVSPDWWSVGHIPAQDTNLFGFPNLLCRRSLRPGAPRQTRRSPLCSAAVSARSLTLHSVRSPRQVSLSGRCNTGSGICTDPARSDRTGPSVAFLYVFQGLLAPDRASAVLGINIVLVSQRMHEIDHRGSALHHAHLVPENLPYSPCLGRADVA